MRHGNKVNALGRKYGHRRALLANLANALVEHKRIQTTLTKAKELRKYIEPLITKAKTDDTHNRRTVFKYLQSKNSVSEMFGEIAQKVGDRPGGYTRIVKMGPRLGDNAEMALIELVDFNELLLSEAKSKDAGKKRRRRRKSSGSGAAASTEAKAADVAETPAAEATAEVVEEVAEEPIAEVVEESKEAVEETTEAVEDATETPAEEPKDADAEKSNDSADEESA